MSWTNVSDATDPSWTSVSDATDPSWGATSEETRPGWKQLSIATDSEGGVDFRLIDALVKRG